MFDPELSQVSEVFRVKCPSCSKVLKVPAAARGRNVECSGCGTGFKISSKRNASSKKKVSKQQPARPAVRQSPRKPTAPAASTPKQSKRADRSFANAGSSGVDDVEVIDDLEVLDDIEVLDEPRQKPARNPKKASAKRSRKSRSNVVEDFEVIEDYDDFLDLPDGYEDGEAVAKPPKRKRKGTSARSARPRRDDQAEEAGIGTVIVGVLCMIAGAGIVYLAFTAETRPRARTIGFGIVLFCSGAGSVFKGLT